MFLDIASQNSTANLCCSIETFFVLFNFKRFCVASAIPFSVKNFVDLFEIDVFSSSTRPRNISTEFAMFTTNCEKASL